MIAHNIFASQFVGIVVLMFTLEPNIKVDTSTYGVFENVLSPGACQQVIDLSKEYKKEVGLQGAKFNKRVSDIYWLPHSPELNELYTRLGEMVTLANNKWWDFHLVGFLEPLQLTHYNAKQGGHYDWHMDKSDSGILQCRKISGSLILNDAYEGGNLELFDATAIGKLKVGSLVLFPSYHVHRVTPLVKGERWSLVFWVTGPRWL